MIMTRSIPYLLLFVAAAACSKKTSGGGGSNANTVAAKISGLAVSRQYGNSNARFYVDLNGTSTDRYPSTMRR